MVDDGLARHRKSLRELTRRRGRAPEPLDDRPAGRVCEGVEDAIRRTRGHETRHEGDARRRLVAELTAQHTGRTLERVLTDGERDRWFTPEEARDYGMIDDIIS
jgi:hypothetical protein